MKRSVPKTTGYGDVLEQDIGPVNSSYWKATGISDTSPAKVVMDGRFTMIKGKHDLTLATTDIEAAYKIIIYYTSGD